MSARWDILSYAFYHLDDVSFFRVPEGWLFRSPFWVAYPGRRPTYLVTDPLKAKLTARLRLAGCGFTLTMVIGFVVIFSAMPAAARSEPEPGLLVFGIVGILFPLWVWAACWAAMWDDLAIRPLVVGLRPTGNRITFADAFEAGIGSARIWVSAFLWTFSGMLLAIVVRTTLKAGWDAFWFYGLLLLGHAMIELVLLIAARRDAIARAPDRP